MEVTTIGARLSSWRWLTTGALATVLAAPIGSAAHGDLDLRIVEVSRLIAASPADAALHLKRGDLHRQQRQWEPALRDFDRAAELDPGSRLVPLLRAITLVDAGMPDRGRVILDAFLREDPDHVGALAARARAFQLSGDYGAAAADLTQLIARLPDPRPEHYLDRARALAAAGRQEDAVRGLDEGLGRLGPIVTLVLSAVDLELDLGRYDAALVRLHRLSAAAVRKETWHARRGEVLEKAGRPEAAVVAFRAALTAIDRLPPPQRATTAVASLEREVRGALARLAASPAGATPLPTNGENRHD